MLRNTINRREPTIEEVQAIKKLTKGGDPYKERGGIIYKSEAAAKKAFVDAEGKPRQGRIGNVTSEQNYAICRSTILLDWNSFNWEDVKAVWVAAELPKPPNYVDECCDGCESQNGINIPIAQPQQISRQNSRSPQQLDMQVAESSKVPRKDWVSSGQRAWADKLGIPVVVYQQADEKNPAPGFEDGAFDIYDPTLTERKAIGLNLYPLSELAGISSVDPAHLNAVAKVALEERANSEYLIYKAWADYMKVYRASLEECTIAYEKLIKENPVREKRLQAALKKLDKIQGNKRKTSRAASTTTPISENRTRVQKARQSALPPASAQILETLHSKPTGDRVSETLPFEVPPMEAFQYIDVSVDHR
ncbi:hypothetical protein QT972_09890 [Microcoleus sp. herbarium7]|uniref:hypothetical protein n=1 Tax=Microcoleus sp. herbarium7 TaxID=3055435 RepID=UPI002FD02012